MTPLTQAQLLDTPLFIDLETRSACDLKLAGGWNYADDPTTHLLTVAWSPAPGEYHTWYPWHSRESIREEYIRAQKTQTINHFGIELPEALESQLDRRWCAHNAWNFDQLVWQRLFGAMHQPADWVDTEPLARAVGLPGGLDAIGKRLWGEGKYTAGKNALKKHSRGATRYGDAEDVPAGVMPMIAEYNVQDVILLRGVWDEITAWLKMPQDEWDVLSAHRAINDRGAPIDEDLLVSLIELTEEGRNEAVKQITELTKDMKVRLTSISDLQSPQQMKRWIDALFLTATFTTKNAKGKSYVSLKRELVQQFIDTHTTHDSDAEPGDDAGEADAEDDDGDAGDDSAAEKRERSRLTNLAVRVLQLRSAALRITGGKLAAAAAAVCRDGRVRGLFVYAGAHTFRWAGRRVQPQNFPRPKDGLSVEELDTLDPKGKKQVRFPTWEMIDAHDRGSGLQYAVVDRLLPDRSKQRYRHLTPDDAASNMVRGIFWTPPETTGAGAAEVAVDWRTSDDPLGLLAADLSGIEARVLAWFAGQQDLMASFWSGADPYIPMAEVMFGRWQDWPGVSGDAKMAKKHSYRTAGKIVRLAAGYQMSGTKMDVYAATNGVDLSDLGTSGPEAIHAYRKLHPMIAGVPDWVDWRDSNTGKKTERLIWRGGIWQDLARAAKDVVQYGGAIEVGVGVKVTFVREGPHLMLYLPSGRRMVYRNAQVVQVTPPFLEGQKDKDGNPRTTEALVYLSPRYGYVHMYGGKWAENVVQAISRDFLAASIVRLEGGGFMIVLHVHDEAVSPGRLKQRAEFMKLFTMLPAWAQTPKHPFPLDAEGGWMPRYSKTAPPGERYKEEVWRNGEYLKAA